MFWKHINNIYKRHIKAYLWYTALKAVAHTKGRSNLSNNIGWLGKLKTMKMVEN